MLPVCGNQPDKRCVPNIFPSLSRAPSFASTQKVEDGTLKDPMESGYVATRPRFTRLRRTWGIAYRHLVAEDLRALEMFTLKTVQGGAGSFYLPNLVYNGFFGFGPALPGEVAAGWVWANSTASPTFTPVAFFNASNNSPSLVLTSLAETIAASGSTVATVINSSETGPANVGDVLTCAAGFFATLTAVPTGVQAQAVLSLVVTYQDGSNQVVAASPFAVSAGYQVSPATFTVPASGAFNIPVASISLRMAFYMGNTAIASVTAAAGACVLSLGTVGLALTTAAQPFGRMPGSLPSGSLVRFSKLPEVRDGQWWGGQDRFDVSFEVTEV